MSNLSEMIADQCKIGGDFSIVKRISYN